MKKDFLEKIFLALVVFLVYFIVTSNFLKLGNYNFIGKIILLLVLLIFYRKDMIKDVKKYNQSFLKSLGKSLLLVGIIIVVMLFTNGLTGLIFPDTRTLSDSVVYANLKDDFLITIATYLLFLPIIEELVFRKNLKNLFKNKILFIVVSAIIYWVSNVVLSYQLNFISFAYTFWSFTTGIVVAYYYTKTNNIIYLIVARAIYNALLIIIFLLTL